MAIAPPFLGPIPAIDPLRDGHDRDRVERDLDVLEATARVLAQSHDVAAILDVTLSAAQELCAVAEAPPPHVVVSTDRGAANVLRQSGHEAAVVAATDTERVSWFPLSRVDDAELVLGVTNPRPGPLPADRRARLSALADVVRLALDRVVAHEALAQREVAERELAMRNAELAVVATTDPLTGVANRREFERWVAEPQRTRFAVLAIDVDGLKQVNDDGGHEAGDVLIVAVASALRTCLRSGDLLARIGGDEFVALITGVGISEASAIADRMRDAVAAAELPRGGAQVTIGCIAAPPATPVAVACSVADIALYAGKRGGRNRVVARVLASTDGRVVVSPKGHVIYNGGLA